MYSIILLYLKVPENSMHLIFHDGFWFVSKVQIWIFGKIPYRSLFLSSNGYSCFFLFQFCYIRFIMWSTISSLSWHHIGFAILLCRIIFCFDIINLYGTILHSVNRDSVSLLRFPLLNHVPVISWVISLICRLKYSYRFFFTVLFSTFISLLLFFCFSFS